jgi:hypothetical protein
MRTYDLKDNKRRVFAFEVSNLLLGRKSLCKVVMTIPNARIIREPKRFSSEETFCEFKVGYQRFTAMEPFRDNSRYWIGPKPPKWCKQVTEVQKAFARYNPIRALWPF